VGSQVYAVTDGTVAIVAPDSGICGGTIVINGNDGARYTYCHLSQVLVRSGELLAAGATIGQSGGQPAAYGSGDATGPHLHLGVSVNGTNVCPQRLLSAWFANDPAEPNTAPTVGCTN